MKKNVIRIVLGSALAIGLTLPMGYSTFADRNWGSDCNKRLENDRARIDRDSARRGEHSRAVDNDVAKLDQDRRWCRDHHADWDHSRFDIGIYLKH